ncbi:MAG: hypothetical protein WDN69_04160 [Aliidongia sp.]
MRLLAGLEAADAGRALLDGSPIRPDDVGVVFQEPRLMPWLDVTGTAGAVCWSRRMCSIRPSPGARRSRRWPSAGSPMRRRTKPGSSGRAMRMR